MSERRRSWVLVVGQGMDGQPGFKSFRPPMNDLPEEVLRVMRDAFKAALQVFEEMKCIPQPAFQDRLVRLASLFQMQLDLGVRVEVMTRPQWLAWLEMNGVDLKLEEDFDRYMKMEERWERGLSPRLAAVFEVMERKSSRPPSPNNPFVLPPMSRQERLMMQASS